MTWVRRQADEPQTHNCEPPMREVEYDFPSGSLTPPTGPPKPFRMTVVDGAEGDLWRCDECRELWRVAEACDYCDEHGPVSHAHIGPHSFGGLWRPARLWQRIWARVTRR
jgi:hypothetical protein